MANNVLTGRLFDENSAFIGDNSVRYFGIHRSGSLTTVSNTRTSEDGFYNFNLGDPDWLGQDRQMLVNDDIAIVVWQNQSEAVNSTNLTRFSVHFFKHTGLDVYVKDLQLLPSQAPSCKFSVNEQYDIGETITVTNQSSDMFQWEYNGLVHWHRDSVLGVPLFDIGLTTEYDFNGVKQSANTYSFSDMGTVYIGVLNTNRFGLTSECSTSVNISYRPPVTDIQYSPSNIQLGTVLDLNFTTTDIDSTVTNIEYFVNNVSIGSSADLVFNSNYTIAEVKSTVIKAVVYWNDGYTDKVSEFTKTIAVENQPPVTELSHTQEENVITATHESYDPDGEIVSYKWEIFYTLPFSDEVRLVYEETEVDYTTKTFTLPRAGEYKIRLVVTDNLGATGFDEFVTTVGSVGGECVPDLIICDTIVEYRLIPKTFNINTTISQFKTSTTNSIIKTETHTHSFGVDVQRYSFEVSEYNYKFNASKESC